MNDSVLGQNRNDKMKCWSISVIRKTFTNSLLDEYKIVLENEGIYLYFRKNVVKYCYD